MEIKYQEIIKYLNENSIDFSSKLNDNTIFSKISSVDNAQNNDLSFFSNIKYIDSLKLTKAKACLINKEFNTKSLIFRNIYFFHLLLSK